MELDDKDVAYVTSLLPEGAVLTGLMTVVTFMDSDGEQNWKLHRDMDMSVAESVGLLELAKMHIIASAVTGIPFGHPEGEDD